MKYDSTTAAVSLTVFNFALETGQPPRSPGTGPPDAPRPRVLMTRRGTLDDASDTLSTVVHAVPHDPVDEGYDLLELVEATVVELDAEVIFSSRISSGLRQAVLCSADTSSPPETIFVVIHCTYWLQQTYTINVKKSCCMSIGASRA